MDCIWGVLKSCTCTWKVRINVMSLKALGQTLQIYLHNILKQQSFKSLFFDGGKLTTTKKVWTTRDPRAFFNNSHMTSFHPCSFLLLALLDTKIYIFFDRYKLLWTVSVWKSSNWKVMNSQWVEWLNWKHVNISRPVWVPRASPWF